MAKTRRGTLERMLGRGAAPDEGALRGPQLEEARRRIAECKATRATELDLGGLGLVELPDEIDQLVWLKRLHLGHDGQHRESDHIGGRDRPPNGGRNSIRELPSSIDALSRLEYLDIAFNQLTELSPCIKRLSALKYLALSGNNLTALPAEIGHLAKLQVLTASNNRLTAIPAEIGDLLALRQLYLHSNQLTELPAEVPQLGKLQRLGLNDNRLNRLPRKFDNLRQLRYLGLSGNRFEELPSQVYGLRNLDTFASGNNQLTSLSGQLGRLAKLEWLNLEGNRLTTLPQEIEALVKLRTLILTGNQLSSLPPEIGKLKRLTHFPLEGNPLPQSYHDALSGGIKALLAYLRGLAAPGARNVFEAKLLLTGEGEVGKTWLAKALRGEPNDAAAAKQSTYGVELGKLQVKARHGTEGNVEIALNTWDFGGQKVYRILHQFFFSGDAIYLLVWKPRMGEEACQLTDWLRRIHLVAQDSARVILVATHASDKDQHYNPLGILRDVDPHLKKLVVDQIEVDSPHRA
jgi:Leucine-rich repeat (LRR) protein